MSARAYTCEHCGGVYEKAWSDEEAAAEASELWGEDVHEDAAIVCDPCFRKFYEPLSASHLAGLIDDGTPVDDLLELIRTATGEPGETCR